MVESGKHSVGVCYGMLGNDLPSPMEVVNLYKSNGIKGMRLYGPNHQAFDALRGSDIGLLLDVLISDLQSLATNPSAASNWVQTNIQPFWPDVRFRYVIVGNELIPRHDAAKYILPAMQNMDNALQAVGLKGPIKVTTAVDTGVVTNSFPPSNGVFTNEALGFLGPIVHYLASNSAPLLVNIYPYFAYVANRGSISFEYATFQSPGTVVQDGQYAYQNLFDAITDAVYAALEKAGAPYLWLVVSESGWPSAGGEAATIDNARIYNQNFIDHAGKGTPRRAGRPLEAYVFAMFNENQKQPPGTENNFGLFYPNKQPVYRIQF